MNVMYEKLLHKFDPEYNEVKADGAGDFVVSPQAYFRGASQLPGAKYNVGFQIFTKPFCIDKYPHRHKVDEYLIFLGGTFPNLFDFDAHIEFTIGEIGKDEEHYVIEQPTIIRIPAGVSHCPLDFVEINKPVFFQAALMQGMFGGIYDLPSGTKEMWYNGPVMCKLHPGKKCNSCRECMEADWQDDAWKK
jgi:hypothetical protein